MAAPGLRFRAFRAGLAAAVADAARALPTRPAVPLLNTLRVTASEDGYVEVVGYDFDVCITATLGVDVVEPGQVLVPGRTFAAFLAGMPDGTIDVEEVGAQLQVKMPRVRYGLNTAAVEDYPGLPSTPPPAGVIDADDLGRLLAKASVAARPVVGLGWSGVVQLVCSAEQLTMAATDRYTVAVATTPWNGPAETATVEVTGKALADALRGMTGDVSVCIDATGIGVVGSERTFISRRIATEYPTWPAVVDHLPEPTTRVLVHADELAAAMARGSRVVSEERHPVRLTVSKEGRLTYDAHAEGKSQLDGEIDVEQITGDPVVLGVNPAYLAEALKPLGTSVVELGIRGPLKGLTVTSPDAPGDVHIIQPVRLP